MNKAQLLALFFLLPLALPAAKAEDTAHADFSAQDYLQGKNILRGLTSALPVFIATGKAASTLNEAVFTAQMEDRLGKIGLKVLAPIKQQDAGLPLTALARPSLVYRVSTLSSADGTIVYYATLELREGIIGKSISSERKLTAALPSLWNRGGLGFISQSKLQSHLCKILDQLMVMFTSDYKQANE